MSTMTKADLIARVKEMEAALAAAKRAEAAAGRNLFTYNCGKFVSMPLHPSQVGAVRDHVSDRLYYDDYKQVGDERHYEEIHESDILPEFNYLLVRYSTDLQGEQISGTQVWGLVPVDEKASA